MKRTAAGPGPRARRPPRRRSAGPKTFAPRPTATFRSTGWRRSAKPRRTGGARRQRQPSGSSSLEQARRGKRRIARGLLRRIGLEPEPVQHVDLRRQRPREGALRRRFCRDRRRRRRPPTGRGACRSEPRSERPQRLRELGHRGEPRARIGAHRPHHDLPELGRNARPPLARRHGADRRESPRTRRRGCLRRTDARPSGTHRG